MLHRFGKFFQLIQPAQKLPVQGPSINPMQAGYDVCFYEDIAGISS